MKLIPGPFLICAFLLASFVCKGQKSKGYKIPKNDVSKSTDSVINKLRSEKVDTICVYTETCGMCYSSMAAFSYEFSNGIIRAPFRTLSYIFWVKGGKPFAQKIDYFVVYKPVERQSTAIFSYAKQNFTQLKSERFSISRIKLLKDGRIQGGTICGGPDDGSQSYYTVYLKDSIVEKGMAACNIDFSIEDSIFIRNFTSCNHTLALIINNEVEDMSHRDIWEPDQKLYYTRKEFLLWKKEYEKSLQSR